MKSRIARGVTQLIKIPNQVWQVIRNIFRFLVMALTVFVDLFGCFGLVLRPLVWHGVRKVEIVAKLMC